MSVTGELERKVIGESLPVGGKDANKFDYKEVWYPIFFLDDLEKGKLHRFTLLEEDLVVWWDEKGKQWRVFADKCPHRLVPLSQGRINEEGLLECPYHGWAFTGEGNCAIIPQQRPEVKSHESHRACVKSYPTAVAHGMLFVYPGKKENAPLTPLPLVTPLIDNEEDWIIVKTFRDVPYDALTLLENVLDASHVPYTHHGTVGNRQYATSMDLQVESSDRQGFRGFWPEGPRKGTLGSQYTTFVAPNLMWHDLTSPKLGRTMTVVYATPITKGRCRLFALFPFQFKSKIPKLFVKLTPRWYSHINQNKILEEDQIFLHYQERYLAEKGGSSNYNKVCYLPTKADLFVAEFRKWVDRYGEVFSDKPFPPTPRDEELLERYHSHTKHCASCRGALAIIKKLRFFSLLVFGLSLSGTPLFSFYHSFSLSIFLSLLTLIGFLSYLGLGKIEREFYHGQLIPKRNQM